MVKTHHPYVRCFWIGTMYLTNGTKMRVHCTHISHDLIEVEAPLGLQGSQKVKLELEASHESARCLIKVICYPSFDVLNEHDKHYIKMSIHTISDKDREFIDKFVKAHN